MSRKAIREYDGKRLLAKWLSNVTNGQIALGTKFVQVNPTTNYEELVKNNPWLQTDKLVAKPDQLIKRRGKLGLIKLNATFEEAKQWISERMNKEIVVEGIRDKLTHFIIEPFCPHKASDEYYVCIQNHREGNEIMFHHEGGVDVGDVDSKAEKLVIEIGSEPTEEDLKRLISKVPEERQEKLVKFLQALCTVYTKLYFAYLEINPLVFVDDNVVPLDLAAKLDETAEMNISVAHMWEDDDKKPIEFPRPFGSGLISEEELYIQELDSKTGASLKLTVLNPNGRIWTMVAGGGASVVYADTITDLGAGNELANYGEYSGDPSESETFEYCKTIIKLMTKGEPHTKGKILFIGGGIANFTDVAETFKGIIRALRTFADELKRHQVKIYVRRGGPNYQEGLRLMEELGLELGLPIEVYGPETHITYIVALALGKIQNPQPKKKWIRYPTYKQLNSDDAPSTPLPQEKQPYHLFTNTTKAIVYGMQQRAVQGMLDFDHICGRKTRSVSCMVYPFTGNHLVKFYWGNKEVMIPCYKSIELAVEKHPDADVFINFASCRSVLQTTLDALATNQFKVIAIIAEGVPENDTRLLIKKAKEKGVWIIGPATVGGIKPGCFKIGNTGGMIDNIIDSKLYRPGNVAYVSKSGGMSNELNNIISRNSNGVYEGIAIGGDKYPGSVFLDHLMRYEQDPEAKILVLLGEIGGTDEYLVGKAIKEGKIKKPLIAWCMGTCAKMFQYEVQFGHAGANAGNEEQTADAKNKFLAECGALVPKSFEEFGALINKVYKEMVEKKEIIEKPELPAPQVPMDYAWAQRLGLIRKSTNFVSTISDERGEELTYAGVPISSIFAQNYGIGGVLGLLWFKRRLPKYAADFIEMILILTADHGPAVSGAHNCIIAARAGTDLVAALCSGLLTIGPRFGGAINDAARQFSEAYDQKLSAKEFVVKMREANKLIMGIGHRIKSLQNPDKRVVILKEFAKKHFPKTDILDFALEVEQITTKKKNNLILNVDGCIGAAFVDLLRSCGSFSKDEADEYVQMGCLNGLFVLGRTIGFIGHYMDQKRLKQGLYRHPWDDISYQSDDVSDESKGF